MITTDKNGLTIKIGDILKYVNEKWPGKDHPLHGVALRKGKLVPTIKRGKKYKSWQPLKRPFTSKSSRWEIIGTDTLRPELLL